jgi:hypothetical protein
LIGATSIAADLAPAVRAYRTSAPPRRIPPVIDQDKNVDSRFARVYRFRRLSVVFLITDFSSITETSAGSHGRFVDQQHGSNLDAKQEGLVFERQTPSPTMRYSVPCNSRKNCIAPYGQQAFA